MSVARFVTRGRARVLVACFALLFLSMTTPVVAQEESCPACDNCYPGLPCYICGVYVAMAVTHCCDNQDSGWAHCVNNEWGFYVDCDGPGHCQCSDSGDDCETLPPLMSGG